MRYSIKQLMAWTVVVSLACAVLFAIPSWAGVAILALVLLWLPVLLVCGVVYGRGWRRTFFIGALIAAAPFLLPLLFYMPIVLVSGGLWDMDLSELGGVTAPAASDGLMMVKFAIAGFLAYVGCTGLAALFSRWLVSPREAASPSQPTLVTPPAYAVIHGRLVTEVIPQPEPVDSRNG
jgi:hypothetical protein